MIVHSLMMVLFIIYIYFYSFSTGRNFGRNVLRIQHEKRNYSVRGRGRIVVSTLCCGRNNPGSNPGHGNLIMEIA